MTERNVRIFDEIMDITDKAELAKRLLAELSRYSIYDIAGIRARQEKEIEALPSPYREKAHPYFVEWQYGRYVKLMAMRPGDDLQGLHGPIKDLHLFREFCDTESRYVRLKRDTEDDEPIYGLTGSLFYFELSCFYLFVLEEPGHPAGMPFPGGFTVERRPDGVYCPIRDKEKDIEHSICNFCPARQDESNR